MDQMLDCWGFRAGNLHGDRSSSMQQDTDRQRSNATGRLILHLSSNRLRWEPPDATRRPVLCHVTAQDKRERATILGVFCFDRRLISIPRRKESGKPAAGRVRGPGLRTVRWRYAERKWAILRRTCGTRRRVGWGSGSTAPKAPLSIFCCKRLAKGGTTGSKTHS